MPALCYYILARGQEPRTERRKTMSEWIFPEAHDADYEELMELMKELAEEEEGQAEA